MCGIAGCAIFRFDDEDIRIQADNFIKALEHRGPDGNGVWFDKDNLLLTHNRLAILDLSDLGHQPMKAASGRYVITFNGEIYNFIRLRSRLEASGTRFRGHSDTEIILALLDAYGIDETLSMIDGMFAFALYDIYRRELTIARDRMGEKPLYYGWVNGRFVFSSELKGLKALGSPLEVNKEVIGDFLSYGYIPTPHSIYQNVYKLSPGTSFTISESNHYCMPDSFSPYPGVGTGPRPYWELEKVKESSKPLGSPEKVAGLLEEKLEDTISRQLIADVPVGCFLSGGVDSSLVTAIAQKVSTRPLKTFTIGFDVEQYNEAHFAKEIANHLGTDHHETYVNSKDVIDLIDQLPQVYDEPFADPSQLPSILVSSVARTDVTVCLSGDGGDELFAGYNRYRAADRAIKTFSRWPEPVKRSMSRFLLRLDANLVEQALINLSKFPGMNKLRQANLGLKIRKFGFLMKAANEHEVYVFLLKFNGLWPDPTIGTTILEQRVSELFSSENDFIATAMLIDQLNYLVDDNLTKVDRSAMSVSLETRLPLLDRQIVELSWKIPITTKVKNGQSKWPLRTILYKHVPESLVERPKMGFSVPLSKWLRNELKDWSHHLLHRPFLQNYVNVEHYQRLWAEHQALLSDNSLVLWPVLVLSQWLEESMRS